MWALGSFLLHWETICVFFLCGGTIDCVFLPLFDLGQTGQFGWSVHDIHTPAILFSIPGLPQVISSHV